MAGKSQDTSCRLNSDMYGVLCKAFALTSLILAPNPGREQYGGCLFGRVPGYPLFVDLKGNQKKPNVPLKDTLNVILCGAAQILPNGLGLCKAAC